MPVYILDDQVLVDGDEVATSEDCCCGGVCCDCDGNCDGGTTQEDCEANNNQWIPDVNCSDDPPPCSEIPTGACCDGADCTIKTELCCGNDGGVYQGDDTTCDPNPCPTGACCVGEVCTIETETHCTELGGTYQGDGTDCDPNPCGGGDTGACCQAEISGGGPLCGNGFTALTCAEVSGIFYGVGSDCNTLPGRGCCCIYRDPCQCGEYSGVTQDCCELSGGIFTAVGSAECGDTHGACCWTDGFFFYCQQKEEIECDCLGGTFHGIGTVLCPGCGT